jgi:hypothetical protein
MYRTFSVFLSIPSLSKLHNIDGVPVSEGITSVSPRRRVSDLYSNGDLSERSLVTIG